MMQSELVTRAAMFATAAHCAVNQRRKYTFEPYIVHPYEVATLCARCDLSEEAVAAAWLHDVVEDTQVTLDVIQACFGPTVALYVDGLTDKATPEHGNRTARKAFERDRLAKTCPTVKSIKLADLICNTRTVALHDPAFARVYLPEKAALLEVLREGSGQLWLQAKVTLDRATQSINQLEKT